MFEFAFMLQHNFCLILFIYLRLFCFVLEKELSRRNLIFFLKKKASHSLLGRLLPPPLGPAPPSSPPPLPLRTQVGRGPAHPPSRSAPRSSLAHSLTGGPRRWDPPVIPELRPNRTGATAAPPPPRLPRQSREPRFARAINSVPRPPAPPLNPSLAPEPPRVRFAENRAAAVNLAVAAVALLSALLVSRR